MRRFHRCSTCERDIGVDGVYIATGLALCRTCAGLVSTLLQLELAR